MNSSTTVLIQQLQIQVVVTKLKTVMQQLQAIPPRIQSNKKSYVSDDLHKCTYMFVRHDAVHKPLQQPYDRPYKVLKRTDKHFTLQIKDREEVVSVDRAIDNSASNISTTDQSSSSDFLSPSTTSDNTRVTRPVCHVRWPNTSVTPSLGGNIVVDHLTRLHYCNIVK